VVPNHNITHKHAVVFFVFVSQEKTEIPKAIDLIVEKSNIYPQKQVLVI
jgi:hypothetical protein